MQQPQQKLKLKALLPLFLLLFITPLSLAEGGDSEIDNSDVMPKEERAEGVAEKNAEALQKELDAFQGQSEEVVQKLEGMIGKEDMAKLQKAMAEGNQEKVNEITKKLAVKIGEGKGAAAGMKAMADNALSQFRDMDPVELREQLKSQINQTLFAPVINSFPKVLDFVVNLFRDNDALPQLFTIPVDRKKLYIFAGLNILLMIIGWIVKRKQKERGSGFFSGFKRWITLFSLRIVLLLTFYGKELMPGVRVFKDTFL
ncbi:MAG: hypothetical protein NXH75_05180 [Halobacteriovoraceae bacterium]|nr:hypothetical protein [Halobacteriovoraceae bacterium]